jgi:formate/nitrite transporter
MQSLILDPSLTAEAVLNSGIKKARLPTWKMFILATLAGFHVCMGAQGAVSAMTGFGSPLTGVVKYFGGLVFSVALTLIVIAGAELFTGNCMLIIACLSKRIYWHEMLKDWFVVYFSNFFGIILFGAIIYGGGINGYEQGEYTASGTLLCYLAHAKSELEPWEMFLRGIGANYMVCMAVLMAAGSKTASGKILSMMFPIASFFVIGFEHSIANMYFFTLATYMNCPVKNHGYYWLNLCLSTIGNILGAGILAFVFWITHIHGTKNEAPAVPFDPASPSKVFHHSVDPGYENGNNEPTNGEKNSH